MREICKAKYLIVFLVIFCNKQPLAPLDPDDEFERAREFFYRKKYDLAIKSFERIIFYHASTEFVDDAQFYLARCYFEKKDFTQAITEFEYLIRNFPNTPFFEPSHFLRAKAYFLKSPGYEKDQSETKEAISLLDDFITRFPNSIYSDSARILILQARSRLAKKELENGRLYFKMKEYDAAVLYFKYVIENYPETQFADEARFLLGLSYEKLAKKQEALESYKELLKNEEWKKHAEKRIQGLGIERP
ncbi:MAG: outer membrane protein assembly factor BamD [candidate division WOR-3 bacterium]|nr:outer membrane protein assembly factor BamD [candidate division WOR-3 bacterium]